MNPLIRYFVNQGTLVNIITVLVFAFGLYALFNINREVFPNIQFDVITVATSYPGAAPESLERLVTNPLEQDLKELDGIKKMTSFSVEGQSVIALQLDPDQTTAIEAKPEVEDIVSSFTDLPEGANTPIVTVVDSKLFPIIEISVAGEVDEKVLRENAKFLERKIEEIDEVAKVNFKGLRDYEIRIEANSSKLKRYQISLLDLVAALQRNNINIPGGVLPDKSDASKEIIIRTIGEYKDLEDVKNTVIRANALGRSIKVKDVCDVSLAFKDTKYKQLTNSRASINLTVMRKSDTDAINLVNKVKQVVEEYRSELSAGIHIDYINDNSYFVKRRLTVLKNNLTIGLTLVLIILSIILPLPVALVTAFGIPFAFLAVIAMFYFGGISLNLISMIGLIIVVGMLVDDAIVITENAQRFIEDGHSPKEAAILGTQNIWSPVAASVMTTVIVFAPMMFMTGIFGKFIYYIPVAVIVSLMVSLWECFFILPHHVASWVRIKKDSMSGSFFTTKIWQPYMVRPYRVILNGIIKLRYVVILLVLGMFAGSLYLGVKRVGFILFPPGAIDVFRIDFKAKTGTSLTETESLIVPYEEVIAELPADELQHYTTTIGRQGMEDMRNMKRGSEYAQTVVYLTDELTRARDTMTIMNDIKAKIKMPEGLEIANFRRVRGGPPVGDPVNIGVRGQNYERILLAVQEIEDELASIEGVSNIENSYIKGKGEIHVKVKEAEAAAASLSLQDIGMAIRAAFEGIVATSIRSVDEEIDLRVTLNQKQRNEENTLDDIQIPNRRGHLISLPRVAEWQDSSGISVYEHEDNRRQVTVTANIDTKVNTSRAVNLLMKDKIKAMESEHRQLSFHFGGEDKDTKESMQSLRTSFLFALFGILLLLILLFKNLYQPLIVATTIPLGIMAVIVAFFAHQRTFSFLAMIGIIALSGVIVNNAIVLLDFVNRARKAGKDRRESLKDAACKRLRPIFLTTITTTAGILPTVYGIGGYDPFVVPLAMALGWGVLGGAFLTTLVLPAIIAVVDDGITLLSFIASRFARKAS